MNCFAKSCFLGLMIAALVVGPAPGSDDEINKDSLDAQEQSYERTLKRITENINTASGDELRSMLNSLTDLDRSVGARRDQIEERMNQIGYSILGDLIGSSGAHTLLGKHWTRLLQIETRIFDHKRFVKALLNRMFWEAVKRDTAGEESTPDTEESTPDTEESAASQSAKVVVTDENGDVVTGLTLAINRDEGTTIVTTDENGEAELPEDSERYRTIVLSGPNLPDMLLSQENILDMRAGAPFVVVYFNRFLTPEEKDEFVTAMTDAVREQTNIPDLVASQVRLAVQVVKDGQTVVPYRFRFYRDADAAAKDEDPVVVDVPALQSSLEEQPDMQVPRASEITEASPWHIANFALKIAAETNRPDVSPQDAERLGKTINNTVETEIGQPNTRTTFDGVYYLGPNGQDPWTVHTIQIPVTGSSLNPDGSITFDLDDLGGKVEDALEKDPLVKKAEFRITILETTVPNDPYYSSQGSWGQKYDDQWALRRVGFSPIDEEDASAWPAEWLKKDAKLARCIVAVIGSGVDYFHSDLRGHLWMNLKEKPFNDKDDDGNGYVDDFLGWNFRENNANVMDYGGHDTHIAGVIASGWNNNEGIAGVNPAALIMPLKIANFLGEADSISAAQAIAYAVDHGARVINLSYDGPRESHILQSATDYAASKGVLVVGAAGNESEDTAGHTVSGARGVFTVAGTTLADKRVGFSNWGQAVDLAAPALDVLSLRARGTDFLLSFGENPDYEAGVAVVGEEKVLYRAGGTSFGAPIVAGTASLLWSLEPDLTLEQVKRKLLMSAEDIETPGWDQYTGAGMLNAKKAIEADPDYYLYTRVSKLTAARRRGQLSVDVHGRAEGSQFAGRWLQIGPGEEPGKDDWVTVDHSKEPVEDGLLGSIPTSRFDQGGVWMVRLLVQDERGLVRQSRARLNLE